MSFNIIIRSTAALGGTPFRLNKCTALGSAGAGAAGGAAVGGVPGAIVIVTGKQIQRLVTGKEKLSQTVPVKVALKVSNNINKSLKKAIKGTKLDTIKTNVDVAFNKGKVNKEMKKFSDDYKKSIKKLNKNSTIVVSTDKKKTKETQKAVNSAYNSMSKAILNHYAKRIRLKIKTLIPSIRILS